MATALPVPARLVRIAFEILGEVDVTIPFVLGVGGIRAQWPRAAWPRGRRGGRRQDAFRRVAVLHPVDDQRERVERAGARPAAAVLRPRLHEQADEFLRRLEVA